jgi:polyisoprenoid-binding protein YceI
MKKPIKTVLQGLLVMVLVGVLSLSTTEAADARYTIDPTHTFPSFEADHFGISIWRGKMNQTKGAVNLNRAARSGSVDVSIDLISIDFGMDALNVWAIGPEFFDTSKHPTATFVGRFSKFKKDVPTQVDGQLTLHGITRPLTLTIKSFACRPHPMLKREMCGADAYGTFQRDAFGLVAGKDYGFKMDVALRIQVEAVKDE